MSTFEPAVRAWSARRWVITVSLIFCLQTGLAWWLSDKRPLAFRANPRPLRTRLVLRHTDPALEALLTLNDPTQFVLPRVDSYSGRAWLEGKPLAYRSPGWSNPPQWLQFKPDQLLADFARFAATNQPEIRVVTARSSSPPEPRVNLDPASLPTPGTRLQITGQLSANDLVKMPDLPTVEYAGLLAPTVVSILVDQQGRVFAASLAPDGTSTLAAADKLGIELAQSLQFVVDPRISPYKNAHDFARLREARVVINWWTRAPRPSTNAPAVQPAAPTVQKL